MQVQPVNRAGRPVAAPDRSVIRWADARAAATKQLLVKFEVFFSSRVLHARGDRDMGGLDRALAQDRELLEDESQIGIGLYQIEHVGAELRAMMPWLKPVDKRPEIAETKM